MNNFFDIDLRVLEDGRQTSQVITIGVGEHHEVYNHRVGRIVQAISPYQEAQSASIETAINENLLAGWCDNESCVTLTYINAVKFEGVRGLQLRLFDKAGTATEFYGNSTMSYWPGCPDFITEDQITMTAGTGRIFVHCRCFVRDEASGHCDPSF